MNLVDLLRGWPWWVPLTVIVSVNILFFFIIQRIYKILGPRLKRLKNKAPHIILQMFYRPLQGLLFLAGFSILVSLYAEYFFDMSFIGFVKNLLHVGVIFCFSWASFLLLREIETLSMEKRYFDTTTIELMSKLGFIFVCFFTSLLVLPLFGVQIGGILAFGGFGGIIVGLAAKDALANILSGIVMAIEKPFKIGDLISSLDEKMEGVVEHIGWRTTKIRMYDMRSLFIPNQVFSTMSFINTSRMTNRRLEKVFGVRYQDAEKIPAILTEIREYIKRRLDVDHSLLNYIHLVDYGQSSLDFKLRVYTKTVSFSEYMYIAEDILLAINQIIEKHEAALAYPTTTLDIINSKEFVKEMGLKQNVTK